MPCGELIEDGDYNHPPSEQQPWFTKAEQLLHNTAVFFHHAPTVGLERTGTSFTPQRRKPCTIFNLAIYKGKSSHSHLYMMQTLALQHTSTDVHLAVWH